MEDGKRVAIVQSNYVPWRGYFDLIASVDEFILLDDVQYTRRDWRNRNRIKTPQGPRWLTIPVRVSGRYTQLTCETEVEDSSWAERHWEILRLNYRDALGFDDAGDFLQELYRTAPGPFLSDINRHFLDAICRRLEIQTTLTDSRSHAAEGTKSKRLIELCRKSGATEYVSGPAAKDYLDEDAFSAAGIAVKWFRYGPYPQYEQLHAPFESRISILDTLLCVGDDAARFVHPLAQLTP
jgi:WbqC-like protein family